MGLEALKGKHGGLRKHRCIPVLLELKRFTETRVDIKQLIATEFQVCGFPDAQGFSQKALDQGKLLILLDGLDEVPMANRDAVIGTIQDFVDQYDQNRYITSCRIAAYRHNFRRFTDVTIAEFDDDQIYQFTRNWFQSEEDKQSGTAERCWTLLQQPENLAATELEEVLLSEIACESFDADRLFLSQAELVGQIKTFLASNLNAPKHLSGEAVLNAIAVQQGILVERAEDVYSFSHLTLQEYLTARYTVDNRHIESLVAQHFGNRRWQEVFLLVSGLMVIGSGADELLQHMNQAIQTHAANIPKLQALLQWTNQITAPAPNSQQFAAKRAAVLGFALALGSTGIGGGVATALLSSNDFDLAVAPTAALALTMAINPTLDLNSTSTAAPLFDLDFSYYFATTSNLVIARSLAFTRDFLFNGGINFALLVKQELDLLSSTVPKPIKGERDAAEWKGFVDRFQDLCSKTLKLNPDLLKLTRKEQDAIDSYLYMNRLKVQCQQEASRVSPQTWEGILATMLVPNGANG